MNDLAQLQERAVEVRRRYDEYGIKQNRKPWSNTEIAIGFAVDIGELLEIIMAKEGLRDLDNIDEKLKHELSDCLWSIFVLADKYEVDIKKEFLNTMDQLDKKLGRQLSEG